MRRLSILTAAIVAAACLASPAMAADPVKTLTKRVTALEKQVRTLKGELDQAQERLACLGPVLPFAQYGGVVNGIAQGYLYAIGETVYVTTSLDFVGVTAGMVPGVDYGLMMTWAPSCASTPPAPARALGALRQPQAGRPLLRFGW
jgi:hypothetical protein